MKGKSVNSTPKSMDLTGKQEDSLIKGLIYKFKNLLAIGFLVISIVMYILSLEGCHEAQAVCLKNLSEGTFRQLFSYLWKDGFILATLFNLTILSVISKSVIVLMTIAYGYLCLIYDTGANLDYHGAFNRAILGFFFIAFITLQLSILGIYKIFRKFPKSVTIIILLCLLFIVPRVHKQYKTSCKHWKQGLKGVEIDDSSPCTIKEPEICYIDILDRLTDISYWLGYECNRFYNGDYHLYEKYLKINNPSFQSTKRIGFPRTENYTLKQSFHGDFNEEVLKDLFDYDDKQLPDKIQKMTEVYVDYSGKDSKIVIDVKRDEELAKTRKSIYDKNPQGLLEKNFLILYIDALSRRHFHRKLPNTAKWLEKHYKNPNSKYTTYQFMKYHSVGYYTVINTIPSFFGKWWLDEDGGAYFTKFFKRRGAVTGQAMSYCGKQSFEIRKEEDFYYNKGYESFDHEMASIMCDPNYTQVDNPYTPFLGSNASIRRCLHGKDVHDYVIEYTLDFWKKYKQEPKVFYMNFLDAHEASGEVVQYLDDKLVNFLNTMDKNGDLEDTVVMMMADHGQNMSSLASIMFESEDFEIEKYLPFLFFITPKRFSDKYGEHISKNEQKVVTPWDLYDTLLDFSKAPNKYSAHGSSLFGEIDDRGFNCEDFLIREDWCKCKSKK